MTTWWDPHAEKYRSTFPHKVVFGFGWPVIRWMIFHTMSSDMAHHVCIKALRPFGYFDQTWRVVTFVPKVLFLFLIWLPVEYFYLWFWERTGLLMVGPKPLNYIE